MRAERTDLKTTTQRVKSPWRDRQVQFRGPDDEGRFQYITDYGTWSHWVSREYFSGEGWKEAIDKHEKEGTMRVGDKVRAKTTGWKGKDGVIVKPYGPGAYEWYVKIGNAVVPFNEEELELIDAGPTDAEIDAALLKIKEKNGLCGEFDVAVARARTMPYLERLDHLAIAMGRGDLYRQLEDILFAEPWEHPTVPDKGDYVRVTRRDGSTREGEVTEVINSGYGGAWTEWATYVDGVKVGWIFSTKERTDTYYSASRTITNVEKIARPLKFKKGDVVKHTHTGNRLVITGVCNPNGINTHDVVNLVTGRVNKAHEKNMTLDDWAVGDVVPAGIAVGRKWSGLYEGDTEDKLPTPSRTKDYEASRKPHFDRKIIWLEEKEA